MICVPMTPEQFSAKAAQLKAEEGIVLDGNEGTISKDGVTGTYAYDGTNLTVVLTHHPFEFSESFCEHKLSAWLTS